MFRHDLMDNKEGIALMADGHTWRLLNRAVHDVASPSPLIEGDSEEVFLALAYEARKAGAGRREAVVLPEIDQPDATLQAVEFAWPYILVWLRVFRASLPFIRHRKFHQALAYALEGAVEEALEEEFGDMQAEGLDSWLSDEDGVSALLCRLDTLAEEFLTVGDAQKKAWLSELLGLPL